MRLPYLPLTMSAMKGFIPPEKYKEILDLIAIPCLDVVARHQGKFLLIKRENEPEKGRWGLPGGRIFKSETFVQAANRKLKEEANLTGTIVKITGPYETFFKEAPFGITSGVHSVNVAVLMDVEDITPLRFDKNHSGAQWFSAIGPDWHPYVRQVLRDC